MQTDIFTLLVYLLPIFFMLHDFEEIIFKPVASSVTRTLINKRFPQPAINVSRYLDSIPSSAFTLAVAEEFLLLSIITIHALITGFYYLWIGVFIAFSIHLFMHLLQWCLIRKYIPCIVTTILFLPYCLYGNYFILSSNSFDRLLIFYWSVGSVLFTYLNLAITLIISKRIFS